MLTAKQFCANFCTHCAQNSYQFCTHHWTSHFNRQADSGHWRCKIEEFCTQNVGPPGNACKTRCLGTAIQGFSATVLRRSVLKAVQNSPVAERMRCGWIGRLASQKSWFGHRGPPYQHTEKQGRKRTLSKVNF